MSPSNPLLGFVALRNLPRVVWVTALASLVNRAGTMALPFLSLFLVQGRAYEEGDAAKFLALFGFVAFCAGPISGRLVDRYGAKSVIVSSFLGAGTLVTLVPFAPGKVLLALSIAGWALANEVFRPAMLAHLGGCVGPEFRKQAFVVNRWATNLGMSVGPAVGGFLAVRSFKLVFLVDGITSLMALAIVIFGVTPTRRSTSTATPPRSPFAPLADPRCRRLLLATVPLFVVIFQMDSTVSVYVVRHLALSPSVFGLLGVVNTILIVLTEIPLNHSTAHVAPARIMAIGATFIAVGFGSYGLSSGFLGLAVSTAIWTVGEMLTFPAISLYVSELSGDHNRGAYMGMHTFSISSAFVVGPWLGLTLSASIPPATLWPLFGLLGLVSAALFTRVATLSPSASRAALRMPTVVAEDASV